MPLPVLPTLTGATAEAVDKSKVIIPRSGRKDKRLNVEIIDKEHKILAVGSELLPEKYKGHILVLYCPISDAVALSKDNPVFSKLTEFISEYLSLSDWQRKLVLDECSNTGTSEELIEIMRVLNRIIRVRRSLTQRKRKAGIENDYGV